MDANVDLGRFGSVKRWENTFCEVSLIGFSVSIRNNGVLHLYPHTVNVACFPRPGQFFLVLMNWKTQGFNV